eukprot:1998524-Pleurochrysis_carterae.AAC.5
MSCACVIPWMLCFVPIIHATVGVADVLAVCQRYSHATHLRALAGAWQTCDRAGTSLRALAAHKNHARPARCVRVSMSHRCAHVPRRVDSNACLRACVRCVCARARHPRTSASAHLYASISEYCARACRQSSTQARASAKAYALTPKPTSVLLVRTHRPRLCPSHVRAFKSASIFQIMHVARVFSRTVLVARKLRAQERHLWELSGLEAADRKQEDLLEFIERGSIHHTNKTI